MITRRSMFGLALVPLATAGTSRIEPLPLAVEGQSFIAPGHRSADPCLLTEVDRGLFRIRNMKDCKLYTMPREEWERLWFGGRMMHIPED